MISVWGCASRSPHGYCVFQLLLAQASRIFSLGQHAHASILLADQTTHPTRHVILKSQMKDDINVVRVPGIDGINYY